MSFDFTAQKIFENPTPLEKAVFGKCHFCGDDICEGETYFTIGYSEYYACERCVEMRVAERGEYDV